MEISDGADATDSPDGCTFTNLEPDYVCDYWLGFGYCEQESKFYPYLSANCQKTCFCNATSRTIHAARSPADLSAEKCVQRDDIVIKGSSVEWRFALDWQRWCASVMEGRSCSEAREHASNFLVDCGLGPRVTTPREPLECQQKPYVIIGKKLSPWSTAPQWKEWCDELLRQHPDCNSAVNSALQSAGTDCGIVF